MMQRVTFRPAAFSSQARPMVSRPQQQQAVVRQRSAVCRVTPEAAAAVTQQAIAYALVLGAEGAFSFNAIPAGDKGRPQVPLVGAGVAGTLAAIALVSLGGESPVSTAGLVVGLGASGAMLAVCAKRVADLEYNDGDWPGPKAWPATMALISFFAFSVFWQAIFAK